MSARGIAPRQFLLFLAGGIGCALIDVGLMWWLLRMQAAPFVATSVGFLAGLVANYAFHSRVTFDSAFTSATFVRFMAVVMLNYLLTLATVTLAVLFVPSLWIDSALVGKIAALPLVAVNGYWLSKHWIFK
jgi:putative flippase GtrA